MTSHVRAPASVRYFDHTTDHLIFYQFAFLFILLAIVVKTKLGKNAIHLKNTNNDVRFYNLCVGKVVILAAEC